MEPTKRFVGEKYNLRWNSHKSSLVNYLADHLTREELVDVTLTCEGRFIKAHKLILSACSAYFKELFQIHKVDNPLIILNNVKFGELKYVIDFIYNGEIRVLDSDIEGVLRLGNNLKIKGLSNIKDKKLIETNEESIAEGIMDKGPKDDTKKHSDDEKKSVQEKNKIVETGTKLVKKARTSAVKSKKKVLIKAESATINVESKPKSDTSNRELNNVNCKSDTSNEKIEDTFKVKKRKMTHLEIKEPQGDATPDNQKEPPSVEALPAVVPELDDVKNVFTLEVQERLDSKEPLKNTTTNSLDVQDRSDNLESPRSPTKNSADVRNVTLKPVSAFMIFAKEWRKRLTVEHPNETNKQISLRLGNMWKNLSDETKDTFYEAASRAYAKMKNNSDNR